jgi:conjugal transfer pilus assembly protein TraU
MKFIHSVLLLLATLLASLPSHAATCKGKFANPITDICWSCMFPLRIAGITLASLDQEDTPNPGGNPACFCGNPPSSA